jgi:hypothetical protein
MHLLTIDIFLINSGATTSLRWINVPSIPDQQRVGRIGAEGVIRHLPTTKKRVTASPTTRPTGDAIAPPFRGSFPPASIRPQIKLPHHVALSQIGDAIRGEYDLAVNQYVAAVGDARRLLEILFGHQHREAER